MSSESADPAVDDEGDRANRPTKRSPRQATWRVACAAPHHDGQPEPAADRRQRGRLRPPGQRRGGAAASPRERVGAHGEHRPGRRVVRPWAGLEPGVHRPARQAGLRRQPRPRRLPHH